MQLAALAVLVSPSRVERMPVAGYSIVSDDLAIHCRAAGGAAGDQGEIEVQESVRPDSSAFAISSFSTGGNCVAVHRLTDGGAIVRHSDDSAQRTTIAFTRGEWDAFVRGVKAGEFDPLG